MTILNLIQLLDIMHKIIDSETEYSIQAIKILNKEATTDNLENMKDFINTFMEQKNDR